MRTMGREVRGYDGCDAEAEREPGSAAEALPQEGGAERDSEHVPPKALVRLEERVASNRAEEGDPAPHAAPAEDRGWSE